MSEITISREDLLKAKRTAESIVAFPLNADDYLYLAGKILAGDKNYSAGEGLFIAAFMGLKNLGFDNSRAVDLVAEGLKGLGVTVTDPPISPSR